MNKVFVLLVAVTVLGAGAAVHASEVDLPDSSIWGKYSLPSQPGPTRNYTVVSRPYIVNSVGDGSRGALSLRVYSVNEFSTGFFGDTQATTPRVGAPSHGLLPPSYGESTPPPQDSFNVTGSIDDIGRFYKVQRMEQREKKIRQQPASYYQKNRSFSPDSALPSSYRSSYGVRR